MARRVIFTIDEALAKLFDEADDDFFGGECKQEPDSGDNDESLGDYVSTADSRGKRTFSRLSASDDDQSNF